MRLWYLIGLILFIESISILMNERYDVTYHLEYDPNWTKTISYSGCYKLIDIFKNETKIKISRLNDAIANYLTKSYNTKKNKVLFLKKLKLKDYYINNRWLCIIGYHNLKDYLNIATSKKFDINFVFNNDQLQFFNIKKARFIFNQIIIHNLQSPYSNCKIGKLNRFKCLNDCNKKNNKLSKYYYHGKELNSNQIIKIKFSDNDKELKDNETKCLEECKNQGDDCQMVFFKKEEEGNMLKTSKTTIFRAYPLISRFDYCIQFVGLIFFFIDLCFYRLLIKLIKIIKKMIKFNLIKYLNYLKFLILTFMFIFLSFSIYKIINDYLNKRDYPIRKEITTTELELKSINLIVCIPIRFISNYNYKNKTLAELENDTTKFDLFNKHVKKIYLRYQNKQIKINYQLNDKKILFTKEKRCYLVEIDANEYKYQNQLLITKLTIEFKYDYVNALDLNYNYDVYILSDNQNFNYKSYENEFNYLFVKKEIKRSKSNRINRCKENDESKSDQINNCLIRKFIDNRYIPVNLAINKEKFTNYEWTNLSFNYNAFNFWRNYFKYLNECEKNYSNILNCYEIQYKSTTLILNLFDNTCRIELYHDVIKEIEQEPSIYKLLMDILNIQSILFGLNIFNLISILFNYDKIKFKYNKILIYLLCLIGFSYHLWFIFDKIINGDLIYSQHYKLKETFKMPNFILCVKYNKNLIDLNHKLNYKYLDKITNQLNIKTLMNKIEYLNKSNEWIEIDDLNIDTFYFLDQKCFEIKFNLEFNLEQFQFKEDYFNEAIKLIMQDFFIPNNEVKFMFRIPDTIQFSKINNYFNRLKISIELMKIDYDDKFNLIKNPLSLIYGQNNINDVDKYLNNLIDNFKINYNLVTLNLPLNNSNELLIEGQLFDQFYLQIQNVNDHKQQINPNFKRTFLVIYQFDYSEFFSVNLIFIQKIIKITNEDNYTKLILNLLNLVSLWFGIGLFDLNIYLDLIVIKIKFIFISLYELLIKIDNHLYKWI